MRAALGAAPPGAGTIPMSFLLLFPGKTPNVQLQVEDCRGRSVEEPTATSEPARPDRALQALPTMRELGSTCSPHSLHASSSRTQMTLRHLERALDGTICVRCFAAFKRFLTGSRLL